MAQFIQILKLVLTILPLILDAVKAIEAALPEGGKGSAKLQMIKDVLQASYSTASDISMSFDQLWPTLEKTVTAVVTLYNSTGAFKKQ